MIFSTRVSNETPGEMSIETDIHQCSLGAGMPTPQQMLA
jgi:hypothetical protein